MSKVLTLKQYMIKESSAFLAVQPETATQIPPYSQELRKLMVYEGKDQANLELKPSDIQELVARRLRKTIVPHFQTGLGYSDIGLDVIPRFVTEPERNGLDLKVEARIKVDGGEPIVAATNLGLTEIDQQLFLTDVRRVGRENPVQRQIGIESSVAYSFENPMQALTETLSQDFKTEPWQPRVQNARLNGNSLTLTVVKNTILNSV